MGNLARAVLLLFLATVAVSSCSRPHPTECSVSEEKAYEIGVNCAIYGYPLVMMDLTRRFATNVSINEPYCAPMNQFAHATELPTSSFRQLISPNVDILYSNAWLDLSREPIVFHLPEISDRYFLFELFDGWSNVFASLGPRTTGRGAQNFLICGTEFKGEIPQNVTIVNAPTNMVWMIGRTECLGRPDDIEQVNMIQSQYTLTPLSEYGKAIIPSVELRYIPYRVTKESPQDQVADMNAVTYFNRFSQLLQQNPPRAQDSKMAQEMAQIGIGPKRTFEVEDICPDIERGLKSCFKEAKKKITADVCYLPPRVNSWNVYLDKVGDFGTDYLFRAQIAYSSLGISLPEDIITPYTSIDSNGYKLHGSNHYQLHFAAGELPPVDGFWSLTMYNDENFLVPNPINRYAIQSKDVESLTFNPDGSLDIYIQRSAPDSHRTNWLPAPAGNFILMMRLYWPKEAVLKGQWTPPTVFSTTPGA